MEEEEQGRGGLGSKKGGQGVGTMRRGRTREKREVGADCAIMSKLRLYSKLILHLKVQCWLQ